MGAAPAPWWIPAIVSMLSSLLMIMGTARILCRGQMRVAKSKAAFEVLLFCIALSNFLASIKVVSPDATICLVYQGVQNCGLLLSSLFLASISIESVLLIAFQRKKGERSRIFFYLSTALLIVVGAVISVLALDLGYFPGPYVQSDCSTPSRNIAGKFEVDVFAYYIWILLCLFVCASSVVFILLKVERARRATQNVEMKKIMLRSALKLIVFPTVYTLFWVPIAAIRFSSRKFTGYSNADAMGLAELFLAFSYPFACFVCSLALTSVRTNLRQFFCCRCKQSETHDTVMLDTIHDATNLDFSSIEENLLDSRANMSLQVEDA